MDYYPSDAIKNALKCAFCECKFQGAVKLIQECGRSICVQCHEQLKVSIVAKSGEYTCLGCAKWHTMPPQGLADNLLAMEILKVRPEERALPDKALALKTLIGEVRRRLEKASQFNALDELNAYCDQLREAVFRSMQAKMEQVRVAGVEHLKEVEEYQSELAKALSSSEQPFKRLKRTLDGTSIEISLGSCGKRAEQELAELGHDFGLFSDEWDAYFSSLSKVVSEAELEKAHEEAKSLGPRIEELERRARDEVFAGRRLKWDENRTFEFNKSLLGGLVDDSLPSPSSPVDWEDDSSSVHRPEAEPPSGDRLGSIRLMATRHGPSMILNDFIFLPDASVASCFADHTVKTWSLDGKSLEFKLPTTSAGALAALSHGWLACGCRDGSIQIWDLAKRRLVRVLDGHKGVVVIALRKLPNGNLVSLDANDKIKIWSPYKETNQLLGSMKGHRLRWGEQTCCVLADGRLVTCSLGIDHKFSVPCELNILDTESGALVRTVSTHFKGVTALAVLADGTLAFGFNNGCIRLFDIAREIELKRRSPSVRLPGKIFYMVPLPDGRLAVSLSTHSRASICLVDLEKDAIVESIDNGLQAKFWYMRLSDCGRYLASSSRDNRIKLWSLN